MDACQSALLLVTLASVRWGWLVHCTGWMKSIRGVLKRDLVRLILETLRYFMKELKNQTPWRQFCIWSFQIHWNGNVIVRKFSSLAAPVVILPSSWWLQMSWHQIDFVSYESCYVGLKCSCNFSHEKSNKLTDQQDIFCFNHASTFYTSNNIDKNVEW